MSCFRRGLEGVLRLSIFFWWFLIILPSNQFPFSLIQISKFPFYDLWPQVFWSNSLSKSGNPFIEDKDPFQTRISLQIWLKRELGNLLSLKIDFYDQKQRMIRVHLLPQTSMIWFDHFDQMTSMPLPLDYYSEDFHRLRLMYDEKQSEKK